MQGVARFDAYPGDRNDPWAKAMTGSGVRMAFAWTCIFVLLGGVVFLQWKKMTSLGNFYLI
jgi:hypothetical protein